MLPGGGGGGGSESSLHGAGSSGSGSSFERAGSSSSTFNPSALDIVRRFLHFDRVAGEWSAARLATDPEPLAVFKARCASANHHVGFDYYLYVLISHACGINGFDHLEPIEEAALLRLLRDTSIEWAGDGASTFRLSQPLAQAGYHEGRAIQQQQQQRGFTSRSTSDVFASSTSTSSSSVSPRSLPQTTEEENESARAVFLDSARMTLSLGETTETIVWPLARCFRMMLAACGWPSSGLRPSVAHGEAMCQFMTQQAPDALVWCLDPFGKSAHECVLARNYTASVYEQQLSMISRDDWMTCCLLLVEALRRPNADVVFRLNEIRSTTRTTTSATNEQRSDARVEVMNVRMRQTPERSFVVVATFAFPQPHVT